MADTDSQTPAQDHGAPRLPISGQLQMTADELAYAMYDFEHDHKIKSTRARNRGKRRRLQKQRR